MGGSGLGVFCENGSSVGFGSLHGGRETPNSNPASSDNEQEINQIIQLQVYFRSLPVTSGWVNHDFLARIVHGIIRTRRIRNPSAIINPSNWTTTV